MSNSTSTSSLFPVLARGLKLPLRKKMDVAKAVPLLLMTKGALKLWSFKTVLSAARRGARMMPSFGQPGNRRMEEKALLTEKTAHILFPGDPCLPQAIVVGMQYWRRNQDAEILLGAKKDDNEALVAHAWVERDGKIIVGGGDEYGDYQPLRMVEEIE